MPTADTSAPRIDKAIANTIVDPTAFADWDRSHNAFKSLRASAPLAVAEPDGFDPFWVVTKFDDIQAIERQNDLFHNGDHFTTLSSKEQKAKILELTGGSPHIVRSLVQMDNPDHMAHRMITQGWFMPQKLANLEERIREIAKEFADKMFESGRECDFATDIAFLYPLRVVMEVIGVPQADEPRMLKLTQELFGAADPDLNRTGEVQEGLTAEIAQEVVLDFFNYFDALNKDRRDNPRDDLATIIATAEVNGKPIGHFEAMCYYIIAATAGHDTTSASSAGSMWALAERPDQFAALKNDPSLINNMIEESIRWETPVKHFMRTATADTELRGQKVSKDDWIYLAYSSGNRDEEKFDRPYEFDISRKKNKHVAFGYGAHVCLGQHLARMEMRLLWEELLPRLKSVELAGTPTRMQANFVCGPKSVPIRFVVE